MIKFFGNIFFCLLIVAMFICYFAFRYFDGYEASWLFKIDGLIQALLAAILFLVLVFIMVKPSIKIADYLAEVPARENFAKTLRIKIVNHSLFRAYDLEINVFHKERISLSGFDIQTTLVSNVKGYKAGTSYLQSAFLALFEETKTNAVQLRFKITDPLTGEQRNGDQEIMTILSSSNSYLEIHVSVRHGLSGLQGNYVKKYHNTSRVKSGFYKHGFLTGIVSG